MKVWTAAGIPVTVDKLFPVSDHSEDRYCLFPGFCDVHVHFREPGFSYKETIATGSMAAARGGYTAVCTMPNLKPVPDSVEHLNEQLEIIRKDAAIHVYPYGACTVGEKGEEPADLSGMAADAVAFSDDGRGIQSEAMMKQVMEECKRLGMVLAAHCEDNALTGNGVIFDGTYAAEHGIPGIPAESEWGPIARDLKLVEETGCAYHVCHISTKESVDLIRKAKAKGLDVTCETGPHYLLLCDENLQNAGRFKMKPPIASAEDRDALLEGIADGTIDMIATDHAPHSAEEKDGDLLTTAFGITGIETAFPLLYTNFVRTGIWTMEKLLDLLVYNARKRFNIPLDPEDYSIWDLEDRYWVDPQEFISKGKATPFVGEEIYGRCLITVCGGKEVYREDPSKRIY